MSSVNKLGRIFTLKSDTQVNRVPSSSHNETVVDELTTTDSPPKQIVEFPNMQTTGQGYSSAAPGPPTKPPMTTTNIAHSDKYGQQESQGRGVSCLNYYLYIASMILFIITLPFSLFFTTKVVTEYRRAVILRLGRLVSGGAKGPGLFFILPCIDDIIEVDIRVVSFDVPPQEILTRDSVTVKVDAVVYYKVFDPVASVINISNVHTSVKLLAASTLRNQLGTKHLSEILSGREDISKEMQEILDEATDPWGIKVERVEVKDVRLPTSMQRAMAAEAEATREAKAKVISAEGEQKASVALNEAAEIIAKSPAAIQLRYLQTLNTISAEKNSTIIFPIPISLLNKYS